MQQSWHNFIADFLKQACCEGMAGICKLNVRAISDQNAHAANPHLSTTAWEQQHGFSRL